MDLTTLIPSFESQFSKILDCKQNIQKFNRAVENEVFRMLNFTDSLKKDKHAYLDRIQKHFTKEIAELETFYNEKINSWHEQMERDRKVLEQRLIKKIISEESFNFQLDECTAKANFEINKLTKQRNEKLQESISKKAEIMDEFNAKIKRVETGRV